MQITLQHIFNLAWQRFIVEQANPCVKYNNFHGEYHCRYSNGEGGHCAVGLALPKIKKEDDQERTFSLLVELYPEWFDMSIVTMEEDRLRDFQSGLHDGLINPKTGTWKLALPYRVEKYKDIAKQYGLEIPSGS